MKKVDNENDQNEIEFIDGFPIIPPPKKTKDKKEQPKTKEKKEE